MSIALTKTVASAMIAGTLALTASAAPAFADFRPHGGYHGGWHGGGWHGGWRGGGWGWAPFAVGGLLAGAAVAATSPYWYGGPYNGDPCYRLTPTYNQYGAYVGRHWNYVCQ